MSTTTDYSTRFKQAQETIEGVSEARSRDAKALLNLIPTPGNGLLNASEMIDQNRRIAKRFVDVNVEYVQDLAAAVRKHLTGLASVWKDEVVTTGKLANKQAEKYQEAAIDQAEEIQRAERAAARQAKKVSRAAAAERYEHMTKVELSEELASRDLPKAGNVDELRDRLIENDLQDA
jgi:hypothetical protein